MNNRCFVISPIGAPGTEVREHADEVLKFIVEPAMNEFGITVVRSDRLAEPGKISEQMLREIATDDLCRTHGAQPERVLRAGDRTGDRAARDPST